MSIAENHAAGAGLASLELHRSLIMLLIMHGVIPKDMTIEPLEGALLRLETMNAGAAALNTPNIVTQLQSARFQLTELIKQLHQTQVQR